MTWIVVILPSAVLDSFSHAFASEWQIADSHPDRVGQRVSDRSRHRAQGEFARPLLGLAGRIDNPHQYVRDLGEPEDRVAVPGHRRYPHPVKADLLAYGPTCAL